MCTLLVTFLQNVTLCVAYVTKISDHSLSIFSSILSPTACDHTIYMCHVFCITRNFYKIKCKLLYWQLAARTRAYFLTSIKVQVIEACVILYWKNNCFTWLAHLGLLPLRFSSLSLTESAINKETTTTKWKPKRIRRQEGKSRKNPTTTNVCSEVKWSGLQNYKKAAGGGTTKVLISLHGWKSKLSGVIQGVATYIPAVSFIHKNCTYSTSDSNWCLAAVWQHLGRHTHLHIHTYAHMCIDFSNHSVCVCLCSGNGQENCWSGFSFMIICD